MSPRAIDIAVTKRLREGLSLYRVDEVLLREIAPDLIVRQDLCQGFARLRGTRWLRYWTRFPANREFSG